MTCGCAGKAAPTAREDAGTSPAGGGGGDRAAGEAAAAERAERAAVCMGCLGRRGMVREGFVPVVCQGRPVEARVATGSCPRGKYADGLGRTRWLGLRWRGAPLPLRWWAWAQTRGMLGAGAMRTRDYRGCGCVDAVKGAWEVLAALFR